jgi:excisionase family DNA binding protein
MRTIDQTAAWLQEHDPGTAFTKTALRRLVVSGKLPSVKVGQKYLINLDTLEDYLQGSTPVPVLIQGIREVQL